MPLEKTEGIILHSIPFRDYDQIITLYTHNFGLISAVVKAARSKRKGLASAIAPITRVEIVFKRGRQDLHLCQELSPLDYQLFLREDFNKLNAACELAKAIKVSQGAEKPSPDLYLLLKVMVEKIKSSQYLNPLTTAFRLKILKHDGLLYWNSTCSECQTPLIDHYYFKGEPFCSRHYPQRGIHFTKEQFDSLSEMIHSRQFKLLESLQISDNLALSVKDLFEFIYL